MANDTPIDVKDANFESTIKEHEWVLVDFWAPWCGPCLFVAPMLKDIAKSMDNLVVAKLNVDENPQTAGRFGIMSIPTMILFHNGEMKDKQIGAFPRKELLEAWIKEKMQG